MFNYMRFKRGGKCQGEKEKPHAEWAAGDWGSQPSTLQPLWTLNYTPSNNLVNYSVLKKVLMTKFLRKLLMISIYVQKELPHSVCTKDKPQFKDVLPNICPKCLQKFPDHEKQGKPERRSPVCTHKRRHVSPSDVAAWVWACSRKRTLMGKLVKSEGFCLSFDKCAVVVEDVNNRGSWVKSQWELLETFL